MMRDYESTSKALRCCQLTSERGCAECPYIVNNNEKCAHLLNDAADAIEELLAKDKNVPDKNVGEWIAVQSNGERFFRCSRCGAFLKESFFNLGYSVNYCPNCGSAMMEVINDA